MAGLKARPAVIADVPAITEIYNEGINAASFCHPRPTVCGMTASGIAK